MGLTPQKEDGGECGVRGTIPSTSYLVAMTSGGGNLLVQGILEADSYQTRCIGEFGATHGYNIDSVGR